MKRPNNPGYPVDRRHRTIAFAALSVLAMPIACLAEPGEEFMTGDWGGTRTKWTEAGVTLTLNYIGEYMSVTSGGLAKKGEYLSRADLGIGLDAEKLIHLKGGSFQFTFMRTDGGQPNNHVGALQGVSNIEAPVTAKFIEAWYDQKLFGDAASVRFGLYDLNSEFDVIESAKLYSNPSFGIGADYAQSGANGPSIFPTTSLALRASFAIDNAYAQLAVLDGVPGKIGSPRGTYVRLDPDEGWLIAVEGGYRTARDEKSKDRYMKLAVGAWRYTVPLNIDVNGNPISDEYSQGAYILGEAHLYRAEESGLKGLHGFLRYGQANPKLLQIGNYLGAGLTYIGLLPGRDDDQLGIAMARATNGDDYLAANPGAETSETIWELAYRARITPWLSVQPDIQYVVNPGTDPTVENATVVSLRMFLAF